jgi:hypothetical protein
LDFLVRILFSGLIALVPSENGQELTVLLLNVDHAYHNSDGTSLPHHNPVLIARAGNCTGQCPTNDADIAQFMFNDLTSTAAVAALEEAVGGGGAWKLAGSDLSVRKTSTSAPNLPALIYRTNVRGTSNGQPQIVPLTATAREDYSWVADLQSLCTNGCTLNPAVLSAQPPAGLVAARFKLKSGKVFTYRVARHGNNVAPAYFERLDGQGGASPYTQAITTWLGADIQVSGSGIEIVEEKFDGGTGRVMNLSPDASGKIEVAVLNLPPFVPPTTQSTSAPEVGKHFEIYYDLMQTPPAAATRLVPRAGVATEVNWQSIHPQEALWSDLLNKLRLDVGRGPYDKLLCPIAGWGTP